jgi:PAS domain S-box-containing protein
MVKGSGGASQSGRAGQRGKAWSRPAHEDDRLEREQAEARPHASERLFRTTFDRAVVGIAHVAPNGRWLRFNQRLCDLLGYTRDELATRTFQDVTHPDDLAASLACLRRLLAGEQDAGELDKRYLRKDGTYIWVHVTFTPVRTPEGAPDYFITMVQDIAERKRLEQERARLLEWERAARREAQAANAQLGALQALTDTALSHLALDDLLAELLDRVTGVMGVDNVGILLLEEDGQTLTMRAARGLLAEHVSRGRVAVGHGLPGRIAASRAPLIVDAPSAADFEGLPPIVQEQLHSIAGVPLLVADQVGDHLVRRLVGVVGVASATPRRFTEADLQLLQRAADRIALAIDRARLFAAEQDARQRAEASEAQAAERAERLNTILETMADAVAVYDAEGRPVQMVNRAYRELYALDRAPAEYEALPTCDRARLVQVRDADTDAMLPFEATPVGRALHGEVVTGPSADIRARAFDGRELEVNSSAAPLREPDGRIAGAVLVLRDMTERNRLAREREAARREVEATNAQLRALQALTDTALSHLALDDLLVELLDRVTGVMGVDNVSILLLDADGLTLTPRAVLGPLEAAVGQVHIPVGQGFAGRIAARREPLIVDDLSTFEAWHPIMRQHLRSVVGVPLLVQAPVEGHQMSRLVGVVHVGSATPRRFTDGDVQLLQRAADRIALAIDRARLFAAEQDARGQAEAALARAQASEAQATERAERLNTILETMADGVVVYDAEGRPVQTNRAYRELLATDHLPGYAGTSSAERGALLDMRDAATGVPLLPERVPAARALRGEVVTGPSSHIRLRALDGRELEVNSSAAPLREPDGRVVGAVSVVRDVTWRRRLEREREEARVQAERQAEQLDRIFEAAAEGLIVYDAEGQLVRVNPAARRILGLDAAPPGFDQLPLTERLARYAARDEHDRPIPPEEQPFVGALRGEGTGPETRDVRMHALDGREIEVTMSAAPLRDREGHLVGAVNVFRDQTERNRLAREREAALAQAQASEAQAAERAERLHTILETIADGVVVYDAYGHPIEVMNRAYREMYAVERAPAGFEALPTQERVRILQVRDAATGVLLPFEDTATGRALRGEVVRGPGADIRVRAFDGRELEVNNSAAPLWEPDGRIAGVVVLLRDMTEHNRLERERAAARADELAAREASRRMEAFLAVAAHDLRSPLTAVVGYLALAARQTELLAAAAQGERSDLMRQVAAVRKRLEEADRGAKRLTRLLTLLFDTAAIRADRLELHRAPGDLVALVREQVEGQRAAAPGRLIHLHTPEGGGSVPVEADADRIGQVVANYLSNALKYAPPDRPVDVSVDVSIDPDVSAEGTTTTGGGWARVAVRDAGPGIPEAERARVWELFHRAPGAEEQAKAPGGSLGLGLYICKAIIEAHGGQVGLESELSKGSTFWFTLPLS